jgi:hypothetical protein
MPHRNLRLFEDYTRFCVTAVVGGVLCIPYVGIGPLVVIVASLALSAMLLQQVEELACKSMQGLAG